MSARVIELLPNKHYRLEGRQHITVNNEEQYIVVQGVIREEDIRPDNSVLSTHIADARLWYTGKGAMAEKQRPAWGGRIFDVFWPF
jgi:flagellar L-ring protein precursor FlgH